MCLNGPVVNDGAAAFFDVPDPSIQKVALGVKREHPCIRLAIVECTEVSAHMDNIRNALKIPVHDPASMTNAMLDAFMPHDCQQVGHEERAVHIQQALQTPVDSMNFELRFASECVISDEDEE